MNQRNWTKLDNYISIYFKGVTPKYVTKSNTIVLNQKCIRNNIIDYSFAQFIDDEQSINSNKYLQEGDLILCSTGQGSAGRCAYVSKLPENYNVTIDSHILVCRCASKNIAICLSNILYSNEKMIMEFLTGSSGQAELDRIRVFNIQIILPPNLNELKQIALLSENLKNKISLNNRINEELESMAKTLYDYWFVQFNFPNEEGKPYKSSGGKMVWNEKLKREIPEGWEVNTISSLIDHSKNGDWGKETPSNTYNYKVQCIRGADINYINGKGNSILPLRYILNKNNHKTLEQGDCIIEISGGSPTQSTGRIALITEKVLERFSEPLICSNFCQAITLKDTSNSFYFYYLWNQLYNNNIFFNYEGKTSGIKNLLFDSFTNSTYWSFPPKSIILSFNKIIDFIHQKRELLLHENHHLSSLRDWLLPMLMNGQVMIRKEANTSGNPPATTAS